jgi:exonuclease VII large subunit
MGDCREQGSSNVVANEKPTEAANMVVKQNATIRSEIEQQSRRFDCCKLHRDEKKQGQAKEIERRVAAQLKRVRLEKEDGQDKPI